MCQTRMNILPAISVPGNRARQRKYRSLMNALLAYAHGSLKTQNRNWRENGKAMPDGIQNRMFRIALRGVGGKLAYPGAVRLANIGLRLRRARLQNIFIA